MHVTGDSLILAATDLSNFLSCRHLTALDMAALRNKREKPRFTDPLLEFLRQRGDEHEKAYIESLRREGLEIVDLSGRDDRATLTLQAMRAGAAIIVQGELEDGQWMGRPDILRRVDKPNAASAFGAWSYEVADTKLARETRAGTILQLGLYSEMLAKAQDARPEFFYVVTPDPDTPQQQFRVDDFAAYVRLIRRQMAATVTRSDEDIAAANYPEPVDHCDVCAWSHPCDDKRHADDHLSLVAGITRLQRRELESHEVRTLTALARMPWPLDPKPKRGSVETYFRVKEQARVQLESRGKIPPLHELRPVEPARGLTRLPDPSLGDIFLDLEGEAFADEGGREYLFGLVTLRPDGTPEYRSFWAFNESEERAAFEQVMDVIMTAWREHEGMHVYHYAPYEPGAFKRLMGRYATREQDLDKLLRGARFIDLYGVVRQCMWAGVESYSIKRLEPLYAFTRDVALDEANRNLRVMEQALWFKRTDSLPREVLASVEGYNKDDCLSTLRLRDWLESLRAQEIANGKEIPRPIPHDAEPPQKIDEQEQLVIALRARLLAGCHFDPEQSEGEKSAVAGAGTKLEESHARWLLAYLLDFHRREDKATWWEYYRLRDLPDDELYDEPQAIAGLEFVERLEHGGHTKAGKPRGPVIDRYRFPSQELEIRRHAELRLFQDGKNFGKVVRVDRDALTIDVHKTRPKADLHPAAAFAHMYVDPGVMEESIFRFAERVADEGALDAGTPTAARDLLLVRPPRLRVRQFAPNAGESDTERAVRLVSDLDETTLAIQGPPGSGKTYTGARMICQLVQQGKKVGVTANSHKAIRNLLDAVHKEAAALGIRVRLAHKVKEDEDDDDDDPTPDAPVVAVLPENDEALHALQANAADVLGATAWTWSRREFARAVSVLFVDEAGQMALANVVAVSQAAGSVVLLGDPQQLEQPRKGTHPDGVGVSALQHVLGDHKTIPSDRGIFLPVTWRLAPSICTFTSELFYEGRLESKPGLERQELIGAGDFVGSGLWVVDVPHDSNRNYAEEEIDVVADLATRLTAPGVHWTDELGVSKQMTGNDILVVSPYNAQVSRLIDRLQPLGVPVGTVDKFQGRQRPVVIYSMATSRPEDAPRGMEFLYSLNRLNVATSRAKCAAILVASPRLFEPECRTPRQMKLANALCRYRELARVRT
jgi:uncharacterized protein